jgi:tetratricopeptide (TPR) repeat protein
MSEQSAADELIQLANKACDQGDYYRGAGYYQSAAEQARQEAEYSSELSALNNLTCAWANTGELQKAIESATRLLTRARDTNNKTYQMTATRLLASRMADIDLRNRWQEIHSLLLEGLEIAQQLDENDETVNHLRRLGEYAVNVGELDKGLDWLQRALSETELLSDTSQQAFYRLCIYESLSILMQERCNYVEAVRYAEMSLGAAQETGNPNFVAGAQLVVARVERARGELAEALRLVDTVLPQALQKKWKYTEHCAEYLRGELLRETGQSEEAEAAVQQALELAQEMKLKEKEVKCLLSLGQVLLVLKQEDKAREVLEQAQQLAQDRNYADYFDKAKELLQH